MKIIINKDELVIKGVRKRPRQGWDEAFARMSADKEDKLLLPDTIDNEAFEWVW